MHEQFFHPPNSCMEMEIDKFTTPIWDIHPLKNLVLDEDTYMTKLLLWSSYREGKKQHSKFQAWLLTLSWCMILKCLKHPVELYVLIVKRSETSEVPYSNDSADPHCI